MRSRSRRSGPNDVLIEIAKTAICGTDMHIYNWDAWAQKTIPVPMAVGHEYCGRIVEMGSEVRGLSHRRPRLRRRAHHLRLLPQLPRRPPPPVPQHRRRRRESPGRLRGVPVDPRGQHLQAERLDQRRHRLDPRSVRQCHAHRPRLQHGGRGRADHRRRSDRHHGRRHRTLRRRAARRHHGRERLPPGARAQDGRHARHQRAARVARSDDEGPGDAGRVRRRPGDVGQRRRLPRDAAHHAPRRLDRDPRHSARTTRRSTGTR